MNIIEARTRTCRSGAVFLHTAILALLALAVTGCGPARTETIVIRGSNTIGEELAPRLIEAFKRERPGVNFDLEFKGTTYGMGALMVERCDLAAASRPASQNEQDLAKPRGIEFNDHILGSYAVAVVVNPANPVTNLTPDEVRDIFTGAVDNWSAVGGPDAPIHRCIREPISGTYLGFQELAMGNKPYAAQLTAFTNYAGIVQAVARDVHGIGYSGLTPGLATTARLVSVGGVPPTADAVNEGRYPYARTLRFYTDKAREKPVVREFLESVQSPRGQQLAAELGFVPRPQSPAP